MNFLSMKYFLTVAEERSFTKAAEKLHITQQTLSAHMAGLEKEVGMKLFLRHVPLDLTDGGEVFYRYARLFQRNELALKRELSDVSGSESGVLRIGVAPSRGQVLLPSVIAAFHEKYPHVRVQLAERANEAIWNALKRDEIDLAIAYGPTTLPGISRKPYMQEHMVLLIADMLWKSFGATEGNVLEHIGFLENCPFLLNSEDDITGAWARKLFRTAGIEPHVVMESENMGTMLSLCVKGLGAYFCPENLAKALLSPGEWKQMHRIPVLDGTYEISFGYQEKAHRWSMIAHFMDIAKEQLE